VITSEIFLIAMVLILSVPYLIWRGLKTDDWAPLVVIQILMGIVLGPGLLGAAFPAYYQFIFKPEVISALNGVAWWAVILFVFLAGLELDLAGVWTHRTETAITAGMALIVPMMMGAAAAFVLLSTSKGWVGVKGNEIQVILGLGMACAVTALPILVLFLEKLNQLRTDLGQRILRYASLDDLIIWAVLALILLDWNRVGRQVIFLAGFVGLSLMIRALMKRISESDRWYIALIWLAAMAFAADWSGLHYMVGAFLAGAVMDHNYFDRKNVDAFRKVLLLAFMPVFFLSTGLRTQWEMGGGLVIIAALILLVAAVSGKLLGIYGAAKILKWPKGEASTIGWLLQTKALIMIIFANILLDKQIITSDTFTALLLMAVMSTMLTIPMVRPRLKGTPLKD